MDPQHVSLALPTGFHQPTYNSTWAQVTSGSPQGSGAGTITLPRIYQ